MTERTAPEDRPHYYQACAIALGLTPDTSLVMQAKRRPADPKEFARRYREDVITAIQMQSRWWGWDEIGREEIGALYHPVTPTDRRLGAGFYWASRALQQPWPAGATSAGSSFQPIAMDGSIGDLNELERLAWSGDLSTTPLEWAWVLPREGEMTFKSRGREIWWAALETMRIAQCPRLIEELINLKGGFFDANPAIDIEAVFARVAARAARRETSEPAR